MRNAVPESASFTGELRSRSIETLDLLQLQAKGIFDQVRDKYKEAVIEDGFNIEFHTYTLDPREKMLGVVNRTLESMGLTPRPEPSGGGTDGNVMRLRGIECVVVGMSTYEMHTVREYVIIPDLVNTATFCQTLRSQSAL